MSESPFRVIDQFQERVKELTCLYDVARFAADRSKDLSVILNEIGHRIPHAWCFAEAAICEIKIRDFYFISAEKPENTVSQQQQIFVENQQVGTIFIHYPSPKYSKADFMVEENALLKKVSDEIANLVERIEIKAREDAFIRNFERQDRLSILGEITAGIAHELNTPLGNILGFAQLILDGDKDPQTQKDARKIVDSAMYAREVVKKLMFFACELPQQYEFVSLNVICQDGLKLLQPMLDQAGVRCLFFPDETNTFLKVDPVQMTQVLFNLVINAVYASPANSTISVRLTRAEKALFLTVEDEGSGIPIEVQERIFEPFYSTKPTGEGSGLGLSVVHGIVKAHGGSIQVASELNRGTVFTIQIPVIQEV